MIQLRWIILAFLLICLSGCASVPPATEAPTETPSITPSPTPLAQRTEGIPLTPTESGPFVLTTTSFVPGEEIPTRYTYGGRSQCNGENYSPELSWSGEPPGTQSYALTLIDSGIAHWVQFNIPADVHQFEEAIGGPEIGSKGLNYFGEFGYGGPCPIGTRTYVFTLYALETMLDLPTTSSVGRLESAMQEHILGQAELIGVKTQP